MTDFVIVVAAVASLAAAPNLPPEVVIPQNAPTIGFRLYKDLHACEAATAQLTPRRGMRHVCVPVESGDGELASAY